MKRLYTKKYPIIQGDFCGVIDFFSSYQHGHLYPETADMDV